MATVTVNVTLAPSAGVASLTVLVTARSASRALTPTDEVLLATTGSNVVAAAVALLVTGVCVVTVAMTLRLALAPLASVPTVHTPPAKLPVEGVALTRVSPVGRASVTVTPCDASGPLLVRVIVNVTLAPTSGVALLTVLTTARLASGTSTSADATLFAGTGSYRSDVAEAVLVTSVWVVTLATMASVAVAPLASVPTVQTPVPDA